MKRFRLLVWSHEQIELDSRHKLYRLVKKEVLCERSELKVVWCCNNGEWN